MVKVHHLWESVTTSWVGCSSSGSEKSLVSVSVQLAAEANIGQFADVLNVQG